MLCSTDCMQPEELAVSLQDEGRATSLPLLLKVCVTTGCSNAPPAELVLVSLKEGTHTRTDLHLEEDQL